ncbi:MAG: hypothetical protein K2L41_11440 [Muribaculaceae bacterium]|nr:hypothetical protein [Muribaculaceae bacterium]
MPLDNKQLTGLIERYFNGATTVEEERMLLDELSHNTANTPEANEARAVLGFSMVQPKTKHHGHRHISYIRAIASIAIFLTTALAGYFLFTDNSTDTECLAYINGKKITDSEAVIGLMLEGLSNIADAAEESKAQTMGSLEELISAMNQLDTL